jgi:hypothetical protein
MSARAPHGKNRLATAGFSAQRVDDDNKPSPERPDTQKHPRLAEDRFLATPLRPLRTHKSNRNRNQRQKYAHDNQIRGSFHADEFRFIEASPGETRDASGARRHHRDNTHDRGHRNARHLASMSRYGCVFSSCSPETAKTVDVVRQAAGERV